MYPKDLLKLLLRHDWRIKRQNGSHIILEKHGQTEVIPFHNKDLKIRYIK